MFATDYSHEDSYEECRPPLWILAFAGLAVTAAFATLRLSDLAGHLTGYLLGSVVCVGLVVLFVKVDSHRRNCADVVYLEVPGLRYAWSAVLIAGVVACGLHAWHVATELAARA